MTDDDGDDDDDDGGGGGGGDDDDDGQCYAKRHNKIVRLSLNVADILLIMLITTAGFIFAQ
jgi:hypothetical protein